MAIVLNGVALYNLKFELTVKLTLFLLKYSADNGDIKAQALLYDKGMICKSEGDTECVKIELAADNNMVEL